MKIILLCVLALVMVVQLPTEGEAVCCHGRGFLWAARCADCSRATPYCSKDKPCNVFGCNCKGGCRTGSCQDAYNHAREMPAEVSEVPPAKAYDTPYDSKPFGGEDTSYDSKPLGSDDTSYDSKPLGSDDTSYDSKPLGSDDTSYDSKPLDSEDTAGDSKPLDSEDTAGDSKPFGSAEYETPASSDSDTMSVPDVTSGTETEVPASPDYGFPADDTLTGSDTEPFAAANYGMPEEDATSGYQPEISTAEDVVTAADENGDGFMDIEEAQRFLVKRGIATSGYRAKRSLHAFDLDNDNFISAEEIEQYDGYF